MLDRAVSVYSRFAGVDLTDPQIFGVLIHRPFYVRRNCTCALIQDSESRTVVEESCQTHLKVRSGQEGRKKMV